MLFVPLYRTSESDILRVTIASLLQASRKTNRTPPFAHKMESVKEIPSEGQNFECVAIYMASVHE